MGDCTRPVCGPAWFWAAIYTGGTRTGGGEFSDLAGVWEDESATRGTEFTSLHGGAIRASGPGTR